MKKFTFLLSFCFIIFSSSLSFSQWTNGQNAMNVIGQPNFTSNQGNTTQNGYGSVLSLWYPGNSTAIDVVNGKMYVADPAANRVLRYNWPITGNQPYADLVFGQADFTSNQPNRGSSVAANTLNRPVGLAVSSNGTLWISDAGNNRILKFNNAHSLSSNGPNADVVLGQPNMTSTSCITTQSGLCQPYGITLDQTGNLWVADYYNNRVLKYNNAASKTNGANADGVLGQSNFVSNLEAFGQDGMFYPSSVAMSGATLFVADYMNHRVLKFDNAASKSNGANADGVLGQNDFVSRIQGATQSNFYGPNGIEVDINGNLYVADVDIHRVTIFLNAASKSNGANADYVLGQSDFTSFLNGTTQNKFSYPGGVSVDNNLGCILVHDSYNNRVLVFQSNRSFTAGSGFPSTQASNITPSELRATSMGLTWNKGNGAGSFLVVKANDPLAVADLPRYGTSYSSYNTNFSSAP
ncbi:MAG: NHL repeat-containing protein, partial [Candidatus Kapabacteria bacterium]|nr:NHL repeat-containing protein [Candidatus Kapabacteria bacterium]